MIDQNAPTSRRLLVSRVLLVIVAAARRLRRLDQTGGHSGDGVVGLLARRRRSVPGAGSGRVVEAGQHGRAVAGMIAGFGICLYYLVGTRYGAIGFYETWNGISSVPLDMGLVGKFKELSAALAAAADDAAKTAAQAAIDEFTKANGKGVAAAAKFVELKAALAAATGDAVAPALKALDTHAQTLANWWGVKNISSAAFGLPVGFGVMILVSLLTKAPSKAMQDFIDEVRVPRGKTVMEEKTA